MQSTFQIAENSQDGIPMPDCRLREVLTESPKSVTDIHPGANSAVLQTSDGLLVKLSIGKGFSRCSWCSTLISVNGRAYW